MTAQNESSEVVYRVSRKRHLCSPPGWWRRRRLDLDYGSVWECPACGEHWRWEMPWGDPSWSRVGPGCSR